MHCLAIPNLQLPPCDCGINCTAW